MKNIFHEFKYIERGEKSQLKYIIKSKANTLTKRRSINAAIVKRAKNLVAICGLAPRINCIQNNWKNNCEISSSCPYRLPV